MEAPDECCNCSDEEMKEAHQEWLKERREKIACLSAEELAQYEYLVNLPSLPPSRIIVLSEEEKALCDKQFPDDYLGIRNVPNAPE
jgi:hypothetical protein